MNKGMDPSYYMATDQCFKCFKKFETQLKATGLWDAWNNKTINGNIDSFITWYKDWVMDSIDVSNTSFISEKQLRHLTKLLNFGKKQENNVYL